MTAGRDIYGFPLNMPFVSVEQIWEEVSNTEIHNILSDDIEFVLSVCIFPYPNYVMSVWIYIAVLYKS